MSTQPHSFLGIPITNNTLPQPPSLTGLPDELKLKISLLLTPKVKATNADQLSLCSLALTCKSLTPCAREALMFAPILKAKNAHLLLDNMFRYPELRKTTRSLTVESKEPRFEKDRVPTSQLPKIHVSQTILDNCFRIIQRAPINPRIKNVWIEALQQGELQNASLLLPLIVARMPKLKELYLGGTALFNWPSFRAMIAELEDPMYWNWLRTEFDMPDWHTLGFSHFCGHFTHKLTVLEWPIDLRVTENLQPEMMFQVRRLPQSFPNLRKLIIPVRTLSSQRLARHLLPPRLETLIFTRFMPEDGDWLIDLMNSAAWWPKLKRLEVYYLVRVSPPGRAFNDVVRASEIDYFEYIPECCIRSHELARHPWMYSPSELNLVEKIMHQYDGIIGQDGIIG